MIVAGMPRVEKENEWSAAMLSGGSSASRSATPAAVTVTVQVSLVEKSVAGSSAYVRGPPETVAACAPLVVQLIEYHAPLTATSSLKVIEMFASFATSTAPFAGVFEATDGAASPPVGSELLGIARLRADEVRHVVVGVLGPTDALVGLVAIRRRHPDDSRALAALRAADPVAADAVDDRGLVGEGDACTGAVGEADPVRRVTRDRARVAAGCGVVREEVVLAGSEHDPCGHGHASGSNPSRPTNSPGAASPRCSPTMCRR